MPYLVKVGYDKNNVRGVTSKGYFIKRSGKEIYTEWGAIDVVGLKSKNFCWHKTTMYQITKFRSIENALEFKNNKIAFLIRTGYSKLSGSTRIYTYKIK
jgi:hypothetical protein